MQLINNLKWRYATKAFDPEKKVNGSDLAKIKKAVQLSVSSYGLQLYKVLVIEDPELKKQLRAASWDQSQITDASHLFVFCNYTRVQDQHIDEFLDLTARVRGLDPADLKRYGTFIKKKLAEKSEQERINWTARQTYLAMGNLLAACAELKIDACPMEGFEADRYNQILGLTERGLNAAVIAPIGYRSVTDETQMNPKVRKPLEVLFELK